MVHTAVGPSEPRAPPVPSMGFRLHSIVRTPAVRPGALLPLGTKGMSLDHLSNNSVRRCRHYVEGCFVGTPRVTRAKSTAALLEKA